MKLDRNFFLVIGIFLGCILLHFGFVESFLNETKSYYSSVYIFTTILFIVTLLIIQFLEYKWREYLGYFFLVVVALKLVAAKIFMNTIELRHENEFKYSFLILYLVSLILITWFTAKKLWNQES
jgi:predicted tellurium resistance membrane protein TerC